MIRSILGTQFHISRPRFSELLPFSEAGAVTNTSE
jgi:hypothetical protein